MLVENQKVKVRWNGNNKKWYKSKGHTYTKYGNEFEVNVEDLTDGSGILVEYICDYCDGENQINEKANTKDTAE